MPDDILDSAQKAINDAAGQPTPAVPPPPAPTADELLASPSPPEPPKQKKKSLGPILAALLLLVAAIPLGVRFASQQQQLTEIRSRANETGSCTGTPPANCRVNGTLIGTCAGKTKTNCDRVKRCGCSWTTSSGSTQQACINRCRSNFSTQSQINFCITNNCQSTTTETCSSLRGSCVGNNYCYLANKKRTTDCDTTNEICCYGPSITITPRPSTTQTPAPTSGGGGNQQSGGGDTGNTTSCVLPPINTICTNTQKPFKGKCAIYHCPQGCGGGDPNKCDENDPGVWISQADCTTKLTAGECGQIDIVDENSTYCDTPNYCTVPQTRCNNCGGGGGGQTPSCQSVLVYDSSNNNITGSLRDGSRKLTPGEKITLATPKGLATKARFRIQGITDTTENSDAETTSSEYRLTVEIPGNVTQSQLTIEAEIFVNGGWK